MFADRVAQNASATSCDMILGKQFLFLFWVSAENSLHWANHWWAFSFHSALMPSATCHIAACHDSKCEETTPLVRNSDFADLCGLGSHGFCEACHLTSVTAFGCTWMSTGLCVQTQTSGEVPWEYLQSFLVSRSWQPTLTFHPCPSRSLQKLADDRSHVCFQMWGQSWRSAYPWATSTWTMRQFCFVWQHCVWHLDSPCRSSSFPACTFHLVS